MSFGVTPLSTTTIGTNQFPASAVYVPGTSGGNFIALAGGPALAADSNGNVSAPALMYLNDGFDVTQGSSGDANTVNSVMGRLTKIRDLLLATLTVSGTVTANVGTTNGIALDATVTKLTIAQATALGTSAGPLIQGSVTTSAPTYTTGTINPLSLTTAGALRVDGSGVTQPVSGTFWQTTQPVSLSSLPALAAGSALIGSVEMVDSGGTNKAAIDAAGNQAIKGGFTEQSGLSAGALNADLVASTDVSGYAWISLHITAIATGGTITFQASNDNFATQVESVNLSRVSSSSSNASTSTTTGMWEGPVNFRYFRARQTTWTSGSTTGVLELYTMPRVLNTLPVSQGGAWTVLPGNTANTTPWLVQDAVESSGGSIPYHNLSAATTNFTNVKAAAAQCYGLNVGNTSASAIYVKLYDKATTPATTDVPKHTFYVPANALIERAFPKGLKFVNGFGWAATAAVGDADNTAIAANCVIDFDLNS